MAPLKLVFPLENNCHILSIFVLTSEDETPRVTYISSKEDLSKIRLSRNKGINWKGKCLWTTFCMLSSLYKRNGVSWPSGLAYRTQVRVWIPVVTLVSLSKTLNHNCFVLRMGRKAVGPVCCVMHVKEPRTLIVKEKGLAPVFLEWQLNAPKLFAPRNRFL